jgi:hypothetical protein
MGGEPTVPEFGPMVAFVEKQFKGSLDDFEALLVSLEHYEPGRQDHQDLPRNFRWNLHAAIYRYFSSIRQKQLAHAYRTFARAFIKPDDVIITFNYDIEIERALKEYNKWEIGDGYGFDVCAASTPRSLTRVLKLHGSTNWFGSRFGGTLGFGQISSPIEGERPFIPDEEFHVFQYQGIRDTQSRPKIQLFATLLTREEKINPSWSPWWNTLWDQASEALAVSDEIYVLGYSLPEADTHPRDLILTQSNREAKVIICAGSRGDHIKGEFKRHEFRDVMIATSPRFENWVAYNDPK